MPDPSTAPVLQLRVALTSREHRPKDSDLGEGIGTRHGYL